MPFQSSFEIEAGKNWGYYEPDVRYILDTFDRPSGNLGISTNGQPWNILSGTWAVNSNYQATTSTAATSYPLATYDLVDINQLAYANVSPGMGVAFSIQNASNWYAIASYNNYSTYRCNCSTCETCNTCTYGCTTGANCSICGSTCNTCGSLNIYTTNCAQCGSTCNTCTYGCTTGANCTACGSTPYTCDCATCYNYYYYLTVLQNVNGTVSTLTTISLSQNATSISVEIEKGVVSYYAYSTNISGIITQPYGLGALLVSGTLSISGTFGTQIGMIESPSSYTQGTTISGFFGTGL
jgi:hypothetical protein